MLHLLRIELATMKREDKPIRYTQYAEKRLRERGVTKDQVTKTVRKPDRREPARREDSEKLTKKFSKTRRVIVIAEERDTDIKIHCAYKG